MVTQFAVMWTVRAQDKKNHSRDNRWTSTMALSQRFDDDDTKGVE